MDQRTVRYVSLDPGETTGWATFDEAGQLINFGQFPLKDHTKKLTELITSDLHACIVENYRNFSWKEQKKWSTNQTSKNIGKIELMCELREVPLHKQEPNIKAIGYKWAGIEPAKDHSMSHGPDAIVHGVYWLRMNGIRKPEVHDD